jgi:hypothetical protein
VNLTIHSGLVQVLLRVIYFSHPSQRITSFQVRP